MISCHIVWAVCIAIRVGQYVKSSRARIQVRVEPKCTEIPRLEANLFIK